MNATYVMVPAKQEYVDVKVSRMEPVTVMVTHWMNAVSVVVVVLQMAHVTVMEI
jgi:hypothetical protein